jgi:hypothetical protein
MCEPRDYPKDSQTRPHRCHGRMVHCWPIPIGGRPLRRRRANRCQFRRRRLRGTVALQAFTDHRCRHRMAHCRPICWRASAPSAPCEPVPIPETTATRDRSPPGLHRSSLPPPDGPLPVDLLEDVRSVGAGNPALISAHRPLRGTAVHFQAWTASVPSRFLPPARIETE